jgi:hypothetical protein
MFDPNFVLNVRFFRTEGVRILCSVAASSSTPPPQGHNAAQPGSRFFLAARYGVALEPEHDLYAYRSAELGAQGPARDGLREVRGTQEDAEVEWNRQALELPACSLGLSATSQQYFSLRTNQPPANQPGVLFSQNKPAPAISHQPNEQAVQRQAVPTLRASSGSLLD